MCRKLSFPVTLCMPASTVARNIIFFDDTLNIDSHTQHVCRVAYISFYTILTDFEISYIGKPHTILCPLDTRYGLLCGIYDHLLCRLMQVGNAAVSNQNKHTRQQTPHSCSDWSPLVFRIQTTPATFHSLHWLAASHLIDQ